jgi:tRNA-modifying protein YgfZ
MTRDGGYFALREGLGVLPVERDVVRVAGPDAESYLQGQTSQDIAKLGPGESAWALVLQPQGKLDAFVRVTKVEPAEFFLDADAGVGVQLVARLQRFKLRTKADIDQLEWRAVAVRGPATAAALPETGVGAAFAARFEWGGMSGYDLLGPEPALPPDAVSVEVEAYEAARIEAGFPRHGAELDDRTIPAEAGLVEASVSFTKGCYTGQELVARIDSRGSNVPRHLRAVLLSGSAGVGARLHAGKPEAANATEPPGPAGPGEPGAPGHPTGAYGKEVGRLTSVARSPRLGWVALGYVSRGVEVGSTLVARDDRGVVEARVELLPVT